jgi:hypothetical protein
LFIHSFAVPQNPFVTMFILNKTSSDGHGILLVFADGEVFGFKCSTGLLFDVNRQICDFKLNVDNCDTVTGKKGHISLSLSLYFILFLDFCRFNEIQFIISPLVYGYSFLPSWSELLAHHVSKHIFSDFEISLSLP